MKKWNIIAVLCVGLLLLTSGLQAAPEKDPVPTQLDGDVITYASKTGVMTARGGVKLTQGTAVMTGDVGEYNTKTKEAVVTGNVFESLGEIDGLSDKLELLSFAEGGCGKMEQWPLPVGFGGPYVRVKNMNVQ